MSSVRSSFILDKLSSLTGERVYKTRGGYLITLTRPISSYTALEPTKRAFRLFDKFVQEWPIGFQYTDSKGWLNQYWTLGGELHRLDGYPALVNYHGETKSLRLGWYYRDRLHRLDGPASEFYHNLDVKLREDRYTEETATSVHRRWYIEGGISGLPSQDFTNFTRVRDEKGEIVELGYGKLHNYYTRHHVSENPLVIIKLELDDFKETFVDGVLSAREADTIMSEWMYKGKLYTVQDGMIDQSMLMNLNLNGWPLYDESIEFLMRESFAKLLETIGP